MRVKDIKERWKGGGLLPPYARLLTAAVAVGVLAGVATFAMKGLMRGLGNWITSGFDPTSANIGFLFYPLAGVLMATLFQKCIGENLEQGTEQIRRRLRNGHYHFKKNHVFSPLIGCIMTVGMGASAGAEGPSAFSGAAIGDRVSKWFHLSPSGVRAIFGAGAAAGIAGIFKSPIGGFFFALEVLRMDFSAAGLIAVGTASLTAFLTSFILSGYTWTVSLSILHDFIPQHIGWIVLMGVVLGLYSGYYSYMQRISVGFFKSLSNRWMRAVISGAGLSLLVFFIPAMFGEGYKVEGDIINAVSKPVMDFGPFYRMAGEHWAVLLMIGVILLLKGAAVGAANSGGGVAGNYSPTVFAGCLAGYLFAEILNELFGLGLYSESFALLGMAGVFAGVIKAPLMAIFLTAEITARYNYILGFAIVAVISYLISRLIERKIESLTEFD